MNTVVLLLQAGTIAFLLGAAIAVVLNLILGL